ncbi:MAG: hypothetical protein KatS3mg077_1497 [Candidatus Binatia bacterium]|nr:MAG: hypothetical protein KatS3mg015_2574 [Fimbriimonadales bacterium]GIW44215.1 MAG: hypothetical protein KatS3mg077_1497 [Candidatus Binatia bacterium]
MNARLTGIVLGSIVVVFGLGALLFPERVMDYAGFAVAPTASQAQATAETRALYGGLFVVLGGWILYAAASGSRQLLVLAGTLFLGAAAGRLGGAYVAGSPGVWGWIGAIVEVAVGLGLIGAAWSLGREESWGSQPATAVASATPAGSTSPPTLGAASAADSPSSESGTQS